MSRLPVSMELDRSGIERLPVPEPMKIWLRRLVDRLEEIYKLQRQDLIVIQVDEDGWIYFGEKDTDGTWRVGRSGNDWNMERRESGSYVAKGASTA